MTENLDPRCSICGVAVNARACYAEEGKGPDNCPTKMLQELAEEANQEYADAKVREFARLASVQ
ncbi:MAG: metal-binding protein, partial [Deltaproteobacteria bacterium]|nr:metal-binding protein [Deltaproteobacteria bacterium]